MGSQIICKYLRKLRSPGFLSYNGLLTFNEEKLNRRDRLTHANLNNVLLNQKRNFSLEPLIKWQQETYMSISNSSLTPIIASIYTSGRNEQYFSKPEEFLPYRWDRSDERKGKLKNHISFASLPFALGARSCVGKKIAMTQITELILQMVDNFDFKCINGQSIKPITSQALIPNKNIVLSLKVRNQ